MPFASLDFGLAQFDDADTLTAVGDVPGHAGVHRARAARRGRTPTRERRLGGRRDALGGARGHPPVLGRAPARRSRPRSQTARRRSPRRARRPAAPAARRGRPRARGRPGAPADRGAARDELREAFVAAPRPASAARAPPRAERRAGAAAAGRGACGPARAPGCVSPARRSARCDRPSAAALLPFWPPRVSIAAARLAAGALWAPEPRGSGSRSRSSRRCSRSATSRRARRSLRRPRRRLAGAVRGVRPRAGLALLRSARCSRRSGCSRSCRSPSSSSRGARRRALCTRWSAVLAAAARGRARRAPAAADGRDGRRPRASPAATGRRTSSRRSSARSTANAAVADHRARARARRRCSSAARGRAGRVGHRRARRAPARPRPALGAVDSRVRRWSSARGSSAAALVARPHSGRGGSPRRPLDSIEEAPRRMSVLRAIESRIEGLFEGVFGRAFRTHVQPVELARKLAKEMDEHRSVSVSRVYVPNEYTLYLSPPATEASSPPTRGRCVGELQEYLGEHARREGYALLGPPRVLLETDDDLAVGEFGIATRVRRSPRTAPPGTAGTASPSPVVAARAGVAGRGTGRRGGRRDDGLPRPRRRRDEPQRGRRRSPSTVVSIPLSSDRVVIGRSRECDIRVEDGNVSRRHAEMSRTAARTGPWSTSARRTGPSSTAAGSRSARRSTTATASRSAGRSWSSGARSREARRQRRRDPARAQDGVPRAALPLRLARRPLGHEGALRGRPAGEHHHPRRGGGCAPRVARAAEPARRRARQPDAPAGDVDRPHEHGRGRERARERDPPGRRHDRVGAARDARDRARTGSGSRTPGRRTGRS